jgi:hypothetical protein
MKTINKCSACGSTNLKQEFIRDNSYFRTPAGSDYTHYPPNLNGCSCEDCGAIFKFNKAGVCPVCKGNCTYKLDTTHSGMLLYSTTVTCPICNGEGTL